MSDVLVEGLTCGACGVEVRPDTQFCFNCGGSLELAEAADGGPIAMPSIDPDPPAGAAAVTNISSRNSSPDPSEKMGSGTEPPRLETASSLRRKTRTMERKPIEIVWEPNRGANVVLIAATVLLCIFAAIVVGLALYYR